MTRGVQVSDWSGPPSRVRMRPPGGHYTDLLVAGFLIVVAFERVIQIELGDGQ